MSQKGKDGLDPQYYRYFTLHFFLLHCFVFDLSQSNVDPEDAKKDDQKGEIGWNGKCNAFPNVCCLKNLIYSFCQNLNKSYHGRQSEGWSTPLVEPFRRLEVFFIDKVSVGWKRFPCIKDTDNY